MPWNPEHYKQIRRTGTMTTLDIKNLTTIEMVELISKLEKEIAFRESVGEEIKQREKLKEIRNYPDGALAYSVTRNP